MRFATLAIDDPRVVGSILAHTHRLGGGAFKKGRRLDARDVARLQDGGAREVTVATLDAGDVHEDDAAARVAALLTATGLEATAAHTGRVNLTARNHGLLLVDHAAIDALNAVHESVTVATLAPHAAVRPGAVVATIKIIPFAVPEQVLDAIADKLAGRAALALHAFQGKRVALLLTTLENLPAGLLDRAAEAQRRRLELLGNRLGAEARCAHDEVAVAAALGDLLRGGAELILVLGASAIVDRRDTVPAALVRSGGTVVQLGMPVDPGNLLMLGDLEGVPVVGLPGCARSLAPSGADFVLQRLLAGLVVDAAAIRGMGVGGLLKAHHDPKPRIDASPRTAAVVLAAGMSTRMGANKLLAAIDGKPMVAHVVDALLASQARPIVVVVGHEAQAVEDALSGRAISIVHNGDYASGLASSVRCGIQALAAAQVEAAVIALGDMPWVSANLVDTLIDAFTPDAGATICLPTYGRKRGNPVLWSAAHFEELTELSGDVGGKVLIERHAESVRYVEVDDAAVTLDVDTPAALLRER
jgi:molybdenum cofactor cytidylyltransferase